MIKETVNYENFDGTKIQEDLYFNISTRELPEFLDKIVELLSDDKTKVTNPEDIAKLLSNLGETGNMKGILEFVTFMLSFSYGEKSEDGKRFVKNAEIQEAFLDSAAFEALIDKLLFSDSGDFSQFTNFLIGVMPSKISQTMKETAESDLANNALIGG